MKRITSLLIVALFLPAMAVLADNDRQDRDKLDKGQPGKPHETVSNASPGNPHKTFSKSPQRAPVVINMTHPSSGGHNRNFPNEQNASPSVNRPQPSYGKLNWTAPNRPQQKPAPQNNNPLSSKPFIPNERPKVQAYTGPGQNGAVAVHHHPYTQGYVRKKLQKIGVTAEPGLITDRSEIVHTSKQYSTIRFPDRGPNRLALTATVISPRHFNDPVVRDHMTLVDRPEWHTRIQDFNINERVVNHYYWHADNGFNYCHYVDPHGYHWWGWYVGDRFFWNRYYGGRWWWYDTNFDRWCFWNAGFWWWQDPYHLGDLYCYNNDAYVPCNSANDQVVVTSSDTAQSQAYTSTDGTRMVKVVPGSQDAFLYDTANPPSFDPVYLASGVESVSFSDTSNGRPLEIVLKLNDGSFDMFDGNGNSYGPGNNDADQAAQGNPDSNPPMN